jgi:hypothetical protein
LEAAGFVRVVFCASFLGARANEWSYQSSLDVA